MEYRPRSKGNRSFRTRASERARIIRVRTNVALLISRRLRGRWRRRKDMKSGASCLCGEGKVEVRVLWVRG